jgi:hypothetical protein
MILPEPLIEVLKQDGVVAIATRSEEGPHLVNTWNGYVQVLDEGRLLIPAGFMNQTQANVATDPRVVLTLGSSKVPGKMGPGTGFLLKGTAAFLTEGPEFEAVRRRFAWARAALVIAVASATQTL